MPEPYGPPLIPALIPGTPQYKDMQKVNDEIWHRLTQAAKDIADAVKNACHIGQAADDRGNSDEGTADGTDGQVPSNVGPGPNAGDSVPAGPSSRPTKDQQDGINDIGGNYGCHTCGTSDPGTKSGNWIGDHQPPDLLPEISTALM